MSANSESLEIARPEVSGLFESILAGGYSVRVQVTGRSMKPFLEGNEVLFIEPVGGRRLRVGDLVLFKDRQDLPVIHRIVRIDGALVQTQGDALNEPDPVVEDTRIMGKVERIERSSMAQVDLGSPGQRVRGWLLAVRNRGCWRVRRFGSSLKRGLGNG